MDCGPACIKMIAAHHGAHYSLNFLKENSDFNKLGTNFLSLKRCFEKLGFRAVAVHIPFRGSSGLPSLLEAPMPCMVHWRERHFVVVYEVGTDYVKIADPAHGKIRLTVAEFLLNWTGSEAEADRGHALIVAPGEQLLEPPPGSGKKNKISTFLLPYLMQYKKMLLLIFAGILLISALQYVFPFLNQVMVDRGIMGKDLYFLKLVLLGMLALFVGRTALELLQNWLSLNLGTSLNNRMVYDFLKKILQLPIRFFDSRTKGDFIQRLQEFSRIEQFVTGQLISAIIAILFLLIFGVILFLYDKVIFLVFLVSTLAYIAWVLLFVKKRTILDYKLFSKLSGQQNNVYEILEGMHDIKVNNLEESKYEHWYREQNNLFSVRKQNFRLAQLQKNGATILSQLKDIIITFFSAKAVIDGSISIGMMLSIQYIIGQLNVPVLQIIAFIQDYQNSVNSIRRIEDIFHKDEEDAGTELPGIDPGEAMSAGIRLEQVSFGYEEGKSILNRVDVAIPTGKTTAIVGGSGSGKSTLLKLLLRFYDPDDGSLYAGAYPAKDIPLKAWRSHCAAVLQNGYIFSETLEYNISLSDQPADAERMQQVLRWARCEDIVAGLPAGLKTKLGNDGAQLSNGQMQRILIARALYKDAPVIIFDEATNTLDTINESAILENMRTHLAGKTVIIVAHRLSTIKEADLILVMDKGYLAEQGTHNTLMTRHGIYAALVNAQLQH